MPTYYQIRVDGHIDQFWSASFENWTIFQDADGATTLFGPAADQAALYGLIHKARDLGLTLMSVMPIDPAAASDQESATCTH